MQMDNGEPRLKTTRSKSEAHYSINDRIGFTCIFVGIYREYLSKSTRPLKRRVNTRNFGLYRHFIPIT